MGLIPNNILETEKNPFKLNGLAVFAKEEFTG